jgi:hypothetical protein
VTEDFTLIPFSIYVSIITWRGENMPSDSVRSCSSWSEVGEMPLCFLEKNLKIGPELWSYFIDSIDMEGFRGRNDWCPEV